MGNELPEDQLTESEQDADIAIRDGEVVGRDGEPTDNLTGGSSGGSSGGSGGRSVEDFDPDNYPGARTVSELGEIRRENYGLTDQEQRRSSRGEDPVGSSDGQTFVQYDPEFDGGSGEVLARGDTREEAAANRLENELREAERRGREPENIQINTENLPFDQNLSDTQRSRASQSRQEAETLQEMQENLPDTERLRVQDDLREELGSEIVQRQKLENFLQEQAEERKEQAQQFEISAIEQERQQQRQQIQEEQQQEPDVLNNQVVTGSDGVFTRIDAATANRQQQSLNEALTGTTEAVETISGTRPAQFIGRGAAGLESLVREGGSILNAEQEFDSKTEEQLFQNRPDRTITTQEIQGDQTLTDDILEFDSFDLDEARNVDQERVDQFASAASRPSAALTQVDDFGEWGIASIGRLGTQIGRDLEQTVTERDTGAGKVDDFNIGEGAAAFAASSAQQAKEDPALFAANLAVDTTAGTAALRGGQTARRNTENIRSELSRADPRTGIGRKSRPGEETPRIRDIELNEFNTVGDLIKGDLTQQTRSTDGKEIIMTNDPNAPGVRRRGQETKEQVINTRRDEDGVVIDPETKDAIETTDLTRREFISDLMDLDTAKGQAQLFPQSRQRARDRFGETSTDVTSPQDRLQDVAPDPQIFGSSRLERPTPDSITFNEQGNPVFIGSLQDVETSQTLEEQLIQDQETDFVQLQEEPVIFDQPQVVDQPQTFDEPQTFDTTSTQIFDTPTENIPRRPDTPAIFRTPFTRPPRTPRTPRLFIPGFGDDDDEFEEDQLVEQFVDEDAQSFPDLFGALGGATVEDSPDQQTFTGFEDRVEKELDRL